MNELWNQSELERHVRDQVEESLNLDYKAADALEKSEPKKREVTKDVSAMANSAGGTIIYGMKEFDDKDRRHLPERIDPIDRLDFSKEWLEQVINGGIRPRIDGIVVHSVDLDTGQNDVAYVVEIPESLTAHQAKDRKYYKRFNFESVAMYDHEIRDVMNRRTIPDVDFELRHKLLSGEESNHSYRLEIVLRNRGILVVNDIKLQITFPNYGPHVSARTISNYANPYFGLITSSKNEDDDHVFTFRSRHRLFPDDSIDVGEEMFITYQLNTEAYHRIRDLSRIGRGNLKWILYADNMLPKQGEIPLSALHNW